MLLNTVAQQTVLWNSLVPKDAMCIEFFDDHVEFIRPTKGRRRIANKRLPLPVKRSA